MRWKTEKKVIGDKRVVRRFLFLPHDCKDGYTYWLSFVTFEQVCVYDSDCEEARWSTDHSSLKPFQIIDSNWGDM